MSISGLPTGRFTFEGFLSTAKKAGSSTWTPCERRPAPWCSTKRPKLLATLEDMAAVFGPDRRISLCRELTKLHEEVLRTTLGRAAAHYRQEAPKGEFVLDLAGAEPERPCLCSVEEAAARARALMDQGWSRKDAVRQVAQETGLPRNAVYDATLS